MAANRIVIGGLQRYWRLTRALTLGAQGCVLDAQNRVLLIRHTYRSGWHFPGGGVELGEPVETALIRELNEETGVIANTRPELFAIYDNGHLFRGDHVVLYVVRDWSQPSVPAPNREIAEQGFFVSDALPAEINPATKRRIREVVERRTPDTAW